MGLTAAKPSLLKARNLATITLEVLNKIEDVIIANIGLLSMNVNNLNAKIAAHI